MTLIKDLIQIPERIQKGDFVLRLAEGVTRPEETLRQYVVTPALQKCFDDALGFIQSAVSEQTSKATYLHGSFGSGKSHFMAVLHLLLQAHPSARAIGELAGTVQKHNEWLGGKKFLLVPYHMIGARDMESGILGGYVEFVRRRHPEAPIPGVYKAEGLFRDAGKIREAMGDTSFFAKLNEGAQSGGWGELESPWDPERYESAIAAPPETEERTRLISSLVTRFFDSYDQQSGGKGEAFVSLDHGLSVISRHAAALGYDALILFLDELVLWLASRASNLGYVHQEGQKLAKLVESQSPDRPAPIVSFIARQRDLSELIGKNVPGAEVLNFKDALGHWGGRFHTITLEDRNLPAIAEKRVLRCRSESARTQLDAAFEQTARVREAVMNVLLTSEGDRQMFRKVYPFSPALVQTLIAVSSALQRERTALKVMMQLLVDSRDTLKVGDLVPVGDLFDVIAHGDEAFSPEMAMHFDNAKQLYHRKLLPMLEKQHGAREEEIGKLPDDDPKRTAFRNDDRLVKTLLLSALVPEVESLRALTAERLAALNHGTIKTPIPGTEGQEVLRKCRAWAATVGEIRLGAGANPTVSVQLSGVDTEVILAQARREDNPGNRMRLIRQMLFEQMGIQGEGELEQYHEQLWRGLKRNASVLLRNLRDLTDPSFENSDESWKVFIGLPFDEAGRSPRDHVSHLQGFMERYPNGARTLCWVPAFLGTDAQEDLGTLVVLEHVLTGERFGAFSNHLSPQDRGAAKSLLDNQRSVLRQRVMQHLEAAYGLATVPSGALDSNHDFEIADRFVSLAPGFSPQPPAAATLGAALAGFLEQALEHQYPGAPVFEVEVKSGSLKKIYEVCLEATRSQDGRVPVDKTQRPVLRQIVNPLLLGEMGVDATHFLLGQHWRQHFSRNHAQVGGKLTVKQLREWVNVPKRMGLSKEAENLVILVFASQTNRTVYRHGGPYEPALASLPDDCELREQKLPEPGIWTTAQRRAGHIFGIATSSLMNALNVNKVSVEAKESAARGRDSSRAYAQHLRERVYSLGLGVESAPRLKTAQAISALIEKLHTEKAEDSIGILAAATVDTTEEAMGECFRRTGELDGILTGASWEMLEAISAFTDERRSASVQILEDVKKAIQSDEHVIALGPALKDAQARALRLLTPSKPSPLPVQRPSPPQPPPPTPGEKSGRSDNLDAAACDKLIKDLARQLKPGEALRVSLTWVIRQEDKKS